MRVAEKVGSLVEKKAVRKAAWTVEKLVNKKVSWRAE